MNELDLAYWAGLIDGEGHIGIRCNPDRPERPTSASKYIARFQLRMSDREIIEQFAADFGMRVDPRSYQNALSHLPLYVTENAGGPAAQVLLQLLPYLRLKRRQAELAIQLEVEKRQPGLRTRYTSTHSYRMRGGRVITRKRYSTGQEHLDRWHSYYEEVRHLNKPGRED